MEVLYVAIMVPDNQLRYLYALRSVRQKMQAGYTNSKAPSLL
jgi:hypothetical protein